jgi:anti-sigma factor ChrR (cupin superfamily)
MQINTDLSQKLAINCGELPWLASPQKGVERVMLERDGGEVARATSLVRYAPKSSFSRHQHDLGSMGAMYLLQPTQAFWGRRNICH